MKILLASPRGFCAGVNRAISLLRSALEKFGAPIYVYHEIVHNTWVVKEFRDLGVVFVDSFDEVPDGSCVMYSAHGVAPVVREIAVEKRFRVVDATCPLVAKIHRQARLLAEKGAQILLIGHAGHDEIVGVVGEAPDAIQVIDSTQDARSVCVRPDAPVAYLTQTTLSVEETARIIDVLEERFPQIIHPTASCICFATQNRQRAVRELAERANLVLIVGSPNSSNSRRLRELAAAENRPAFLIDGADELDFEWFRPSDIVLISAGASAPESVVQSVVERIAQRFPTEIETVEVCCETFLFSLEH
ncbi:MAG: 4-hydroxy-3-methylbut-2-enyl diphosphate reductase [Planctomycetia bacterium]|nr:4-hydroxy-3-methylbut-2-enyl diphosphate reductase [Planctomycetia bacterium]